jgi:hypothetical protein
MSQTSDPLARIRAKWPLPTAHDHWTRLKADPEFFEALLEAIANRQSVREFCRVGSLSYSTVMSWLRAGLNEAQKKAYELSRQVRAASYAEEMEGYLTDLKEGRRNAQETRVLVNSLLKLAKAMDPHIWGDRLQVQTEQKTTVEMHLEGVMELAQMIRQGDFSGTVIEGTAEPKLMPEPRSLLARELLK